MEEGKKKSLQEIVAELLSGQKVQSTNVMSELDTTQNISTDELSKRHAEDNQEEKIDTATIVKSQPFVDDINNKQENDVDGIADGILVVTDPEISSEEFEEVADELQGIVDDTEAGEVPFTDKYDGNYILGCPICGGTFVSDVLLDSGEDACPICCKVPDNFVVNGKIESTNAVENKDELQDEIEDIENQEESPVEEKGPNIPKTLDKDENLLDNEEKEETPLKGESKMISGNKITEDVEMDAEHKKNLEIVEGYSKQIYFTILDARDEITLGGDYERFLNSVLAIVKDFCKESGYDILGENKSIKKITEDEDLDEVEDDIKETTKNDNTNTVSKDIISSTIDVLIADEESAIDGYNSYLNQAEQTVSSELFSTLKEQVDEIIEDEQEHIEKLNTIKETLQGKETNTETENINDEELEESKLVEDKSDYAYMVQGNYGYGWDDLVMEETMEDAKKTKQEYEENEPEYKHRIKTVTKDGKSLTEDNKLEEDEDNTNSIVFSTEINYVDQNDLDFKEWLAEFHDIDMDVQDEAESLGIDTNNQEELDNIYDGFIQSYLEEYNEQNNETIIEDWEENVKPMIEKQLCTEDLLILMGTAKTWDKSGNAANCFHGMNDFDNLLSDYDSITITEDDDHNLNISLGHHDGTHYMGMYTFNGDTEGVYNKLIELNDREFASDNYEDFDDAHSYWSDEDFVVYMIDYHQAELKEFLVPIKNQFV